MNLDDAERAAIALLAEDLPKWQQQYGPGINRGLSLLGQLLFELDAVATDAKKAGKANPEIRTALLAALTEFLATPPEGTKTTVEPGDMLTPGYIAYDTETIEIFARGFVPYYDAVGLNEFWKSIAAAVQFMMQIVADVQAEGFTANNARMVVSLRFREKFPESWPELAKLHKFAEKLA